MTVFLKAMHELGTKRLQAFRMSIWENADEAQYGFLPPAVFLPDDDVRLLLDCFALVRTKEELRHHPPTTQPICS